MRYNDSRIQSGHCPVIYNSNAKLNVVLKTYSCWWKPRGSGKSIFLFWCQKWQHAIWCLYLRFKAQYMSGITIKFVYRERTGCSHVPLETMNKFRWLGGNADTMNVSSINTFWWELSNNSDVILILQVLCVVLAGIRSWRVIVLVATCPNSHWQTLETSMIIAVNHEDADTDGDTCEDINISSTIYVIHLDLPL